MPDLKTIHRLIDQAIQANTSIYIRYRDFHGNISEREISPREWVEPEKIVAFCHLRNEERNFKTYNITAISKNNRVKMGSGFRSPTGRDIGAANISI